MLSFSSLSVTCGVLSNNQQHFGSAHKCIAMYELQSSHIHSRNPECKTIILERKKMDKTKEREEGEHAITREQITMF